MCINILLGKPLPVYGDGQNIRDWLYVEDHCGGIDAAIHKGQPGEAYNIGGNNEVRNLDLVKLLCALMDELAPQHGWNLPTQPSSSLITFVTDRPGHDRRYAMDATKLEGELGWRPARTFPEALDETIDWYLANRPWWEHVRSGAYRDYYDAQYGARL